MKKPVTETIIKVIKFTIIFLIVDFCFGSLTQFVFFKQETGKYARLTYVVKKAKEDIIIFGSSHAHRHYVPEIINDNLNKTCYNAGAEGQQLLYHRALQKMLFKRRLPELIILNIDENFLYQRKLAYSRLSDLNPYYPNFKEELMPILGLKSNFVDFKLLFKSYQTNSTLIHVLRYALAPQIDFNGYRPLNGVIAMETLNTAFQNELVKEYIEEIDDNFVQALNDFIADAKNKKVKIIFVSSPNLLAKDNSKNTSFNKITSIAQKENIPFFDFLNSEEFINNYELFHDPSHLNDKGARLFTLKVSQLIKTINREMNGKTVN